ncbi:MAG: P-loop NTPase [Desulfurococcales archaeon]|nr:P-loop NTPase [Desulfurococcales archaeon]
MSSKGGVGKTLVSVSLALALSDLGRKVGLLDLDITNPSAHVALGMKLKDLPEEEKGVKPPEVGGVEFMTIAYYTKDNPTPLRGWEIDNAVREILAITIWGELDYLLIDTPPGMSDELLDVITFFKPAEPLVVATNSPLAIKSVERLLKLLKEELTVKGVVENMASGASSLVKDLCTAHSVSYLGAIGFDPQIDSKLGSLEGIKSSSFFRDVTRIARKL